ncbi:MAG: signal transduction histidine kinase [Herminiimonas sp.]|nr:signal transduction histidine kinase [Herminiimonas sp.]
MQRDSDYPEYRSPPFFVSATSIVAICLMLAGVIVMSSWHASIRLLDNFLPGISSIKANTGAGFFLAGLSLWLQRDPFAASTAVRRFAKAIAQLLALALLLLGALTLVQDVLSIDINIDQILFRTPPELFTSHPGRMPLLTAACCMLAGAGLLLLDCATRNGHYPAEYCAAALAGIMSIPLIGYLYSVTAMVQVASSSGVASQTSILFILLAAGLLMARPRHRLMALWNSNAPGGHLLRRLLPASLLLLMLLDLLVEWGARRGFYSHESISPLVILLASSWLCVLFWRAALLLNREYDVRRKGEAALSDSNALLRAVSDNTPDAIFVKDRSGRMIFANPATLRMLDKDAEAVIGRTAADFYGDPADAQMVDANDRCVMASGRAEMVEETVNFPYGARTFYSTKAPWLNDRGEVLGLVGISTDITERKRIEDALKAHETQLEALVAARTAEVSELIGHLESTREEEKRAIARELHDDLGSALTALNMHLAILFKQMPAEPNLTERSMQIKALLSSVTQTTRRIQVGLRPDKLDIFGIKAAIAEQALEFENYTGVTCGTSLPDEELAYAPQIDIALFRMVQEALNNIAKHANATHVDVILDDTDDNVILSIRDNGVGIPVRQPAFTVTHGLRGMRERAGYLGGDVKIISAPGKGTNIVITLPKTMAGILSPNDSTQIKKTREAH